MPRGKKPKPAPVESNNPAPELTLPAAHELRRTFRLSSLLTRVDGTTWRLFYADGLRAGCWDLGFHHEQQFEDELQANQEFHRLRSAWLAETQAVAG